MDDHSCLFCRLFLEFRVSGFRINFFGILCTFSQISIALGGVVVVLWSSGGGCYARSRACTKATPCTKAPPCTLWDEMACDVVIAGKAVLVGEGIGARSLSFFCHALTILMIDFNPHDPTFHYNSSSLTCELIQTKGSTTKSGVAASERVEWLPGQSG
jgi:hypothetical protein